MKCNNCDHENPEGNKFCAECGTKLAVTTSTIVCHNCYNQIPLDSKFCPDCGIILFKNHLGYSSIEDFVNGNVTIQGITLGLTNKKELVLSSRFQENSLGFYDVNNPRIVYYASGRNSLISDNDFYNQPINTNEYKNDNDIINSITIFSDYIPNIPFLCSVSGLLSDHDNFRVAEKLEGNNYVIIENITPQWSEAVWLVSRNKNSLGNFVFIMVRGYIQFSQNIVVKCTNLHTKEIIYCL